MPSNYHYQLTYDPAPTIYGGAWVGNAVSQFGETVTVTGIDPETLEETSTTFQTVGSTSEARGFGPHNYITGTFLQTNRTIGAQTQNETIQTLAESTLIGGFPYIKVTESSETILAIEGGGGGTTTASETYLVALELAGYLETYEDELVWQAIWSGYSNSSNRTGTISPCALPQIYADGAGVVSRSTVPEPLFNISQVGETIKPHLFGTTQLLEGATVLMNGMPGLSPLVGYHAGTIQFGRGELADFPSFTSDQFFSAADGVGTINVNFATSLAAAVTVTGSVPSSGPQAAWTQLTTANVSANCYTLTTLGTTAVTLWQSYQTTAAINRSGTTFETTITTASTVASTITGTSYTATTMIVPTTTTIERATPHGVAASTWEAQSRAGDVVTTSTFARLVGSGGQSLFLVGDGIPLNPLTPGSGFLTYANACASIAGIQTWTQLVNLQAGAQLGQVSESASSEDYSSSSGATTNGTYAVTYIVPAPIAYGILWDLNEDADPTIVAKASEAGYLPFGVTDTTALFLVTGIDSHSPEDWTSKANPPYELTQLAKPCFGRISGWLTDDCGAGHFPRWAQSTDDITGLNSTRSAYLNTIESHGVEVADGISRITRETITYTHWITLGLQITPRTYNATFGHSAGWAGPGSVYFPPGIWEVTVEGVSERFTADLDAIVSRLCQTAIAWRKIPYYAASHGARVPNVITQELVDGYIQPTFFLE